MKIIMPDFGDPIFYIGMILVAIYAYIGGTWLQRRYDDNKKKNNEEAEKAPPAKIFLITFSRGANHSDANSLTSSFSQPNRTAKEASVVQAWFRPSPSSSWIWTQPVVFATAKNANVVIPTPNAASAVRAPTRHGLEE